MEYLSSRREREAPGGRARENRKFIQAPSPEIWSETVSGGEEVLAGKWGGLFLGYLLGKNFRRNDDAWGGERACTPGRQEPPGPTPLAAPPALFPSAPLSPSGLELRANSIGAFSGYHEATPLTSSAERATGVT